MDQSTAPSGHGYRILVDPAQDRGAFTVPGVRIMAPDGASGSSRPVAAPPPPPGNLQDVRVFDVPGEDAKLRVAMIDGDPWFVAADVAAMLGYRDAANAVRLLKDREKGTHRVSTVRGLQEVVIISEPGFYRLVMRSNRPEADAFQTWVTGEVLPQIRKTGAYTVSRELTRKELAKLVIEAEEARERIEAENIDLRKEVIQLSGERRSIAEANFRAREELARVQVDHRSAVEMYGRTRQALGQTETALAEAKPKVEGFDLFVNTDGTKPVGVVAQELGLGQNRLFEFLRAERVLISTPGDRFNTPYQAHIETGRFVVKQGLRDSTSDGTKPTYSARVTPKGEEFIYRLVKERGSDDMRKAMDRVVGVTVTVSSTTGVTRR